METASFAAAYVGQMARRSYTHAVSLYDMGAMQLLAAHLAQTASSTVSTVPGAMAIAHLCDSQKPLAARQAIEHDVINIVIALLEARPAPAVCAALCMPLASIAASDTQCANEVAASGALLLMVQSTVLVKRKLGPAALTTARTAIARALVQCTDYEALITLLEVLPVPPPAQAQSGGSAEPSTRADAASEPVDSPSAESVVYVALLKGLASTFKAKGSLRLDFLNRKALTHVQKAKQGVPKLRAALKELNSTFPAQMISATDPNCTQYPNQTWSLHALCTETIELPPRVARFCEEALASAAHACCCIEACT